MNLRLTSDPHVYCTTCGGVGRIPCPPTFATRTVTQRGPCLQPSTGHPIPCPTCKGARIYAGEPQAQQAGGEPHHRPAS